MYDDETKMFHSQQKQLQKQEEKNNKMTESVNMRIKWK